MISRHWFQTKLLSYIGLYWIFWGTNIILYLYNQPKREHVYKISPSPCSKLPMYIYITNNLCKLGHWTQRDDVPQTKNRGGPAFNAWTTLYSQRKMTSIVKASAHSYKRFTSRLLKLSISCSMHLYTSDGRHAWFHLHGTSWPVRSASKATKYKKKNSCPQRDSNSQPLD